MLKFLKKFFSSPEIPQEKIQLEQMTSWIDDKSKTISEDLDNKINQTLEKINAEKEKVKESLKVLETAKLRNPNIPERAITIMEGNRSGFIRKVSYFFTNINLKYDNYKELEEVCKNLQNEIETLGKGTARSYQVLNEFFAREAENAAINIKNIENYSKTIINFIKESKIMNIDKIKNNIGSIQNKIKLKREYSSELDNYDKDFENSKNDKSETQDKINKLKSSKEFHNYEKLLEEKEGIKVKISNLENQLFHDFSVLEKSLKKYAKIAFENDKLIGEYLENPIITLIKDTDLKIVNILDSLRNSIERNELDLDEKKKKKALVKIHELDGVYFTKLKDDFRDVKSKLNDIEFKIKNDSSKNELDKLNLGLTSTNQNIETLNGKISNINVEIKKINIEKLKENLIDDVNDLTNLKITIL